VASVCCAAQPGGFQEDSNRQVIFIFDTSQIYIHFLKRLKRLGHKMDWNLINMHGKIGLVLVAIGFLIFQMHLLQKKKNIFIFLPVNGNTARLDHIINMYLANILLLLIG
jgi:hypothetical protein